MIIRGFDTAEETAYFYAFTITGALFFVAFGVVFIWAQVRKVSATYRWSAFMLVIGNLFAWLKLVSRNDR
jgi:hypothetical protein